MDGAANLWLFVVPFLIAAALPGPAQGALVAQVLSRGGRSSIGFMLGMTCGNALWLLGAIYGLSELAMRFHTAFLAVKWLGIAYLLFIAWKLWTSPPVLAGPATGASSSGLLSGALLALGNPKAVVFFGSILPHAFDMTRLNGFDTALIIALGFGLDLLVQGVYLAVAAKARLLMQSSRRIRILNRGAAALMVSAAGLIAARG